MTNELEKTFFDTFGIEPFIYCSKPRLDCDARNKRFCRKDCEYYSGVLYPQITDRILLELICILSKYQKDRGSLLEIDEISLDEIKEEILEMLIYRVDGCKHQVRTLFEEGNDGF